MYKIKRIKFKNHPVLNNLELNFCDINGNAVDTVILAGENGTGKSTVLDVLYKMSFHSVDCEFTVELENEGKSLTLRYYFKTSDNGNGYLYVNDGKGLDAMIISGDAKNRYKFSGLFSDVDINFKGETISNVTSLELDAFTGSKRSNQNLPKEIKQLLVDIQTLDDADVSRACRENSDKTIKDLQVKERMPRFTNAFNKMFSSLSYSRVENKQGHKEILFMKNGVPIAIDQLSSGEKQIVYRGCFLLKDVNAMNGAFVFIDEPEISLHPSWQEKIMDYYKGIFTDAEGKQTSQIFAVTHSPFVIHNKNRHNDKVIVLARDEQGNIVVQDKPEYYKCDSIEAVKDAFSIHNFTEEKSVVYLEGRTDELYFKKAVEVFGYTNLPFEFQWIGYMKNEKEEENTGKDALNKAVAFLTGRRLTAKNVCLFDCDTSKPEGVKNNVYTRVIPTYDNSKKMKKGIENALVLDLVDVNPYYSRKIKEGDYGDDNTIVTLEKMDLCNAICKMDNGSLKEILKNLKGVIDLLLAIYEE